MNAVVGSLIALALLLLAAIMFWNSLIRRRNLVAQSWHLIDVELQRRHDLIPNVVESVKGYAAHEQATLTMVTAARGEAVAAPRTVEGAAAAERQLVEATRALFAVAEAYPALQADEHFLELQRTLVDTEDRLAVARRIYNANVRGYNDAVQQVPGIWFAGGGRLKPASYFEVDAVLRA